MAGPGAQPVLAGDLLRRHLGSALFASALLVAVAAHLIGLVGRAPAVAAAALLVGALGIEATRELIRRGRRFLWRISRKLFISYLLIGLVPLLLVVFLFGLLAYVATGQFISMVAWRQIGGLTFEVDRACVEVTEQLHDIVESRPSVERLRLELESINALEQALGGLRGRFSSLRAHAVVTDLDDDERWIPNGLEWSSDVRAEKPRWLTEGQVAAELVVGRDGLVEILAADVSRIDDLEIYVEVSLPLDESTLWVLQQYLGLDLRIIEPRAGGTELRELARTDALDRAHDGWLERLPVFGVLFVPRPLRWEDGRRVPEGRLVVTQRSLLGLYRDLYTFQTENTFLIMSLLVLVLVGLLVFETAALGLGAWLARSVTGSVEEMSQGTRRIESGVLDHRIAVHSSDQLGDLSRSFNRMAVAVSKLVRESAERERLEEELRIGRRIQQSLLPAPYWREDRFEVAAYCMPAREVGGDYFDLFELDDERLGLLVADVSGKGTEAAFYMAEVKGIMLALSRQHSDPHAVLGIANKLLGQSLDRRTFVTMAYAVLQMRERRLAFARAGHNPVLHLPRGADRVDVHRPEGMALGIERLGAFEKILEPRTIDLAPDDLVVFYTDGVTEMFGVDGGFYDQERLERALIENRDADAAGVRDALVGDLLRFARPGPAHDDVTLIVLRAL